MKRERRNFASSIALFVFGLGSIYLAYWMSNLDPTTSVGGSAFKWVGIALLGASGVFLVVVSVFGILYAGEGP